MATGDRRETGSIPGSADKAAGPRKGPPPFDSRRPPAFTPSRRKPGIAGDGRTANSCSTRNCGRASRAGCRFWSRTKAPSPGRGWSLRSRPIPWPTSSFRGLSPPNKKARAPPSASWVADSERRRLGFASRRASALLTANGLSSVAEVGGGVRTVVPLYSSGGLALASANRAEKQERFVPQSVRADTAAS